MEEKMIFDKEQINKILPHRDPVLLADLAEWDGKCMTATLFVDPSMDIFKGHFPDGPVFPGVYIIEAMAQCADILLLKDGKALKPYLASVSRMRFIRPVYPGDTLICRAELTEEGEGISTFNVSAETGGKAAAKGVLSIALR